MHYTCRAFLRVGRHIAPPELTVDEAVTASITKPAGYGEQHVALCRDELAEGSLLLALKILTNGGDSVHTASFVSSPNIGVSCGGQLSAIRPMRPWPER